jgi:tight adherence protein B
MFSSAAEIDRAHQLLGGYANAAILRRNRNTHGPAAGSPIARAYAHNLPVLISGVIGLAAAIVASHPLPLLIPVLVALAKRHKKGRSDFLRAESFERDFPALLLSLASGVRTGLDPFSALCKCRSLFASDSEMRGELGKLASLVEDGRSEEDALEEFAASIDHPDIKLFRVAFLFARKEGSSLAETLQRLARVTRQRQSFRRKVRAAVAMQRLSAFGIALCAIVILGIQLVTNPDSLKTAMQSPIGSKIVTSGVLLVVGGLSWMLLLTRRRL